MRTLKVEGLTVNWLFDEESGSGWYDDIWWTNKPTVRYFYDGQMLVEEDSKRQDPVQGPITSVTRYGLGARGVEMIWWKPEGESQWLETNKRFPLYDGHGNMTALLTRNASGFTLSDSREFDAWGRVRYGARTGYPTHRYCASLGHVQDDESGYGTDNATDQGLIYMRARYYDPETGRFVSRDPALDGVNWFAYCASNPVSKIDPNGEVSMNDLLAAVGAMFLVFGGLILGINVSFNRLALQSMHDLMRAYSRAMAEFDGGLPSDMFDGFMQRELGIQENRMTARSNIRLGGKFAASGSALIGSNLILRAFLIDVDLAFAGSGSIFDFVSF